MKIENLTAENIFSGLSDLAGDNFTQKDDMKLLIESALLQGKIQLLEELAFHAKFSNGLLRVMQKKDSTIDEEYFLKAVEEYKHGIEKVRFFIEELLKGSSDFIRTVLTEKYLQLTQLCLSNINLLCSDLSYLKLFFNDIKSGETSGPLKK